MRGQLSSRNDLPAVKAILLVDWDPIGVRDEPAARDEYDTYAVEILDLLAAGVSQSALVGYLVDIEANRMGLIPDSSRAEVVAAHLTALGGDSSQQE